MTEEVAEPVQKELARALDFRARLGLDGSEPVVLDEDLRERLQALGYLDN